MASLGDIYVLISSDVAVKIEVNSGYDMKFSRICGKIRNETIRSFFNLAGPGLLISRLHPPLCMSWREDASAGITPRIVLFVALCRTRS